MNEPTLSAIPELQFAKYAPTVWEALGSLQRTGWVEAGVPSPETVQEHTVATRLRAYEIASEHQLFSDCEMSDLLNMIEVHDWPEAIVGDLVVLEGSSELTEKQIKERVAMENICTDIERGVEILALWERFETGTDEVARFARQMDLFQSVEKAVEYEKLRSLAGLAREFVDYSRSRIDHSVLVGLIANIAKQL